MSNVLVFARLDVVRSDPVWAPGWVVAVILAAQFRFSRLEP